MQASKLVAALVGAVIASAGCASTQEIGPGFTGDDVGPPTDDIGPPMDDIGPATGPKGPQPDFGRTVTQSDPPPPLSGGTLLVSADAKTIFASDPDRDAIYVVDVATEKVVTVALQAHDEPGRLAEDGAGRVHVALRRGGAVVTVDATGANLGRRAACPAPRGIAYDKKNDRMITACEGGEIVAVAAAPDGAVADLVQIDADLRDVVVTDTSIYISRYRNAEMLELNPTTLSLVSRSRPNAMAILPDSNPTLAWRMIASPVKGEIPVMVHELASTNAVQPSTGGYGAPAFDPSECADGGSGHGIVTPALSTGALLPNDVVLPVDIAADSSRYLVVAAGNAHTRQLPQIFEQRVGMPCGGGSAYNVEGQAVAVALLPNDEFVVQSREPAALIFMPSRHRVDLATTSREDTGHAIFHSNSGSGIACASCHGEGGDDAHVWTFDTIGARRTPSLRGTLDGTAPYHWAGEMADVSHLVDDVLSGRMQGPQLSADQKNVLQGWLFKMPAPIPTSRVDKASAARGKTLFESTSTQCTNCHNGDRFTNSATVDVGTGGSFQVPSLVGVAARVPLMHTGCAATLEDRFGVCATAKHGKTSQLTKSEIADLVAYLKTL